MTRLIICLCVLILAACNGTPTREVIIGDLLLRDNFDTAGRWDVADVPAARLMVENGAFRFDAEAGRYIFSVDYRSQTDVIIEVEALHLSGETTSGFGVMCRADADGDGYSFMIGADGSGSIRRTQGRKVTPLVAWTRTGGVTTTGSNRIRAICDGDYLALYVNDFFVGEVYDRLYSSGFTGLVVADTRAGQRVVVEFDALRVYEVGQPPR